MSKQPVIHSHDAQYMTEEYTSWYVHILERIFYPRDGDAAPVPQPSFFVHWLEEAVEKNQQVAQAFTPLQHLHHDFIKQGQVCLTGIHTGTYAMDYKDFKKLNILFEELLKNINFMHGHSSGDHAHKDEETGLNTRAALERNIVIEMERLERHGKPFTLALVKINDFDVLNDGLAPGERAACLRILAGLVQKSIRSFDDAYWIGEGSFVLCLKQSDNSEGIRALARLKNELKSRNLTYQTARGQAVISVSSCITEPVPGDNLTQLLHDLEQDLNSYHGDGAAVLEHHEISPLQRYLKDSAR